MGKTMYGVFSKRGGTKEEIDQWISDSAFVLNGLGFYDLQVIGSERDNTNLTSVFFPMGMRGYRKLLEKGFKLDNQVDEYFFLSGKILI